MEKEIKVFSEKMGEEIVISEKIIPTVTENDTASLVGWSHGGWNNDNGGGSSW